MPDCAHCPKLHFFPPSKACSTTRNSGTTECERARVPEKRSLRGSAHTSQLQCPAHSATTKTITDRYGEKKSKIGQQQERETSHEAVSYAQSRRVCIQKTCLLGLACPATSSVHPTHGGCPNRSWSRSGCAGVHAVHQHDVPAATYWAVKTRTLVAQELVRAGLVTGTRLLP